MPSRLILTVNGQDYDGWKSIEVRDGLQEVPSFSIGFTNPLAESKPSPIQEGDECTIKIDGELVLTGFVDVTTESYDVENHTLSVEGRAKTGDLVDCAAIYGGSVIKDKRAAEIIELLCKPFGISVQIEPTLHLDTKVFGKVIKRFKLEQGQTVWEAVSELCRRKAVMALTTAEGDILLTRSAKVPLVGVTFERGVNVKSASRRGDSTQLHSEYTFKAQNTGDDSTNGKDTAHLKGVLKDTSVKRYRPMVVLSEFAGNREDLAQRAIWERNTRRARAESIDITVRDWHNPQAAISIGFDPYAASSIVAASMATTQSGTIISVNTLPRYRDVWFGYDDDMLIERRVLRFDDNGASAQVSLTGREAYDQLEPPAPRKKRKRRS